VQCDGWGEVKGRAVRCRTNLRAPERSQRLSWVAALPLTWAAAACFEVAAPIFHSGQTQVQDNSRLSYALTSDSPGPWDAVAPENVEKTGGSSPSLGGATQNAPAEVASGRLRALRWSIRGCTYALTERWVQTAPAAGVRPDDPVSAGSSHLAVYGEDAPGIGGKPSPNVAPLPVSKRRPPGRGRPSKTSPPSEGSGSPNVAPLVGPRGGVLETSTPGSGDSGVGA
jgi:hypothetical protein